MKRLTIFIITFFLAISVHSQISKTESFQIAHVSNGHSAVKNQPNFVGNQDWIWRGQNYIVGAWLFPDNFFEDKCPDDMLCGVVIDTVYNADGDILSIEVNPVDTTIVIGDWDCRGFVNGTELNFGTLEEESSIWEHSTQTFNFFETELEGSPCNEGCFVVTDGPINCFETDDEGFLLCNARVVAGGTNKFKFMNGEVTLKLSKGDNISGFPNILFDFKNNLQEADPTYLHDLEVSVKRQTLATSGTVDSISGLPKYGTPLILEGVIYASGTLNSNPNGGIDSNGNASQDSIGTWTSRGWWISEDNDMDDGFFVAGKQVFDFYDSELGPVQIMTDGKDRVMPNESVAHVVTGATDALFGHKGQCIQTIIGKNASGGWNFTYSLSTARLDFSTDINEVPNNIPPISLQLYPNPVMEELIVSMDQVTEIGTYQLDILDGTGRLVNQEKIEVNAGHHQVQISVSSLPNGWYGMVLRKDGLILGSKNFTVLK